MKKTPEIHAIEIQEWIQHLDITSPSDLEDIQKACLFAIKHNTLKTPIPLSSLEMGLKMADILITLQSDHAAIIAAIVYPAVFYNTALQSALSEHFDKTICKIIMGATKIEMLHEKKAVRNNDTAQQNQIDNLRKMVLAMADDIRTILIKLTEKLILLQHANALPDKQKEALAQDTMDYYAPLANRLGIGYLKWQLEDWAFRYLHPAEFSTISDGLHQHKQDRTATVRDMIVELKKLLEKENIKNSKVSGRIKHIYSIYKKMHRKQLSQEKIYDTIAVRILVHSIKECYTALSLVHEQWEPITTEFDDYIAKPKPNGYQSIHTAVLRNNTPIEIQIRTVDMHEKAELGFAAHWRYKENKSVKSDEHEKINVLRELLDLQKTIEKKDDQEKLFEAAFSDRVYVFSPNGDIFDLRQGATPLDFAYLVHTDIGNRCRGAKINGALVPLTYTLKTGDRVDIVTGKEAHPSRDWVRSDLGFLKTQHAIRKVKNWFYKLDYESNLASGNALWEKITHQHSLNKDNIEKLPGLFNLKNVDAVLVAIGSGEIASAAIVQKLHELSHQKMPEDESIIATISEKKKRLPAKIGGLSVEGANHLLTQLAACCHPIPGDNIIGFITKGRGITVHQASCRNITIAQKNKPERLIEIRWEKKSNQYYRTNLEIQSEDRAGLLRDITGVIAQLNLSIVNLQSFISKDSGLAKTEVTLEIQDLTAFENIRKKIMQVKGVTRVIRR